MRVGPTFATGKQGWDKLIGRAVAGFPSHKPGKQEEKAAKPPAEKEEREMLRYANSFPHSGDTTYRRLCRDLINTAPPDSQR